MTLISMRFLCVIAAISAAGAQSFALQADGATVLTKARWYTNEEILQFDIGGVRLKMNPEETEAALRKEGYFVGMEDKKTADCGFEDAVLFGIAARKGLKDSFGIEFQSHYERDQHHMIGANYEGCAHGYVKEMTGLGSDGSSIHVTFVATPKGAVALSAEYQISPRISYNLFVQTAIQKYGVPSFLIKHDGDDEIEAMSWMTFGDKDRGEFGVHVYKNPNLASYLRGDDSRWLELSMGDEDGWRKTIDEAVEQEVNKRMPQVAPSL